MTETSLGGLSSLPLLNLWLFTKVPLLDLVSCIDHVFIAKSMFGVWTVFLQSTSLISTPTLNLVKVP